MNKYQIKSKTSGKIYYLQFFDFNKVWFTPTSESIDFDYGDIEHFEPVGMTWDQLRSKNKIKRGE